MSHQTIYQPTQTSYRRTEDTYPRHFTAWQRGALAFTLWSSLSLALPVQAAGWVMNVTTTTDETTSPGTGCSLREAATNFENNALTYPECGGTVGTPVTINVPAATYSLSNYIGISRTDSLTIQGAAASSTIIDLGSVTSILAFQLTGGVSVTFNDLTLTNATGPVAANGGAIYSNSTGTITVNHGIFTNNVAPSGTGGGIYNLNGTLIVSNSTFSSNSADQGGAIYLYSGSLTITNSTFTSNTAYKTSRGGGAILVNSGNVTISGSTFTNNQANAHAGALLINSGATGTINTSTFVSNSASYTYNNIGGDGGAIYNLGTLTINDSTFTNNRTWINSYGQNGGALTADGAASMTTINRSTFSGNTSTHGGAIFVRNSGSFSLSNSTLTGNSAGNASTSGISVGGGISLYSGVTTATIKNVTIANNTVSGSGGGGLHSNATTTLNLYNSILANNTGSGNLDCYLPSGTLSVNTNNLIMNGNCGTPAVTTNPSLATLANNGGSTQTMALSLGSSALDVGDDASCLSPSQNGLTRPQGTHCDIGAYEMPVFTFSTVIAGTGTGNVTGSTLAGNYSSGTPMTLVAAATGGSTFIGWTPAGCTNGFALTANTVCTATFDKTNQVISFTLPTVATVGDAPLALSATATSGLPVTFASTTPGVCTVSGTTLFIRSAGTCTVTAVQAGNTTYNAASQVAQMTINLPPPPLPPMTLKLSLVGTGTGRITSDVGGLDCSPTSSSCTYTVNTPTWVTLTALPDHGSQLNTWTGDPACTATGQVLILQDTSCTAEFTLQSYQLTGNFLGKGRVTGPGIDCPGQCTATYLYGTTVTLKAQVTRKMWEFSGWRGCDSQGNIQITNDVLCQAVFTPDPNIPNAGDGNGDGQQDADQNNVVSLPDKVTGTYLTLETQPATCVVSDIYPDLPDTQKVKVDPTKKFPQGLLYFDIACPQAQVSVYYHAMTKLYRNLKFYKFGPKIPGDLTTIAWYPLPTIKYELVKIGGKPVVKGTYTLIDGELGDSTGVDGHIVDPGGLVYP